MQRYCEIVYGAIGKHPGTDGLGRQLCQLISINHPCTQAENTLMILQYTGRGQSYNDWSGAHATNDIIGQILIGWKLVSHSYKKTGPSTTTLCTCNDSTAWAKIRCGRDDVINSLAPGDLNDILDMSFSNGFQWLMVEASLVKLP